MPHQARGYPPGVQLRLLPFGEAALQHFVYLERPEGGGRRRRGLRPVGPALPPDAAPTRSFRGARTSPRRVTSTDPIEPGSSTWSRSWARTGCSSVRRSTRPTSRPSAGPTSLRSPTWRAPRALERIVEQGEGATGDSATAHYGRFLGVLEEYLVMRGDDPDFDPRTPSSAAGMRAGRRDRPEVYITDPTTGGCSDLFNAVYELALQMIARYFAFGHETPEQRQVLAHAAVGLMFEAIKPLGLLLARLPVGPEHPGATAGANFQLPYRASFLLPHRRVGLVRFAERLDELAGFATGLHPPGGGEASPWSRERSAGWART